MTTNNPSILLIEKNPFLEGVLKHKLKNYSIQVSTAPDGQEGLKVLATADCALAVVDLPPADIPVFFAVLRRLQTEKGIEAPPVVVISDLKEESDIKKISELGASAYLVKAYTDSDEIISKVKAILEQQEFELEEHTDPEVTHDDDEPADYAERSRTESSEGTFTPTVEAHKRLEGDIQKIVILASKDVEDEFAIVNLVDHIIEYGAVVGASDIHFKPEKSNVIVRLRIDGVLRDSFDLPKKLHAEVISRIKVLGGMRTDEHQAAQDGRFKTDIKGLKKQFDIRVSIVPTYHGEDAVLRLLVEQKQIRSLKDIPFSPNDRKRIARAISKPYGMILATGPTGSGKTTTLYTILKELNTKDVSIITIEDPIEYSLKGVNQIQVNTRTDLTFASGLRSILRQDPDIIMVGEIRDKETAGIAVNAALTGHKLLSTLHTNDAATTLPRLLDMGVEPFLIASTVNIAMGQRLIRMLCQKCKTKKALSEGEKTNITKLIPDFKFTGATFYEAKGCKACDDGYSGRLGIYEILEVDEQIRNAIIERKDAEQIKKIALDSGMTTLLQDGMGKAAQGLTTIEEVLRVAQE